VKILRKGNPNPKWHMKIECHHCRALLEIEESDVEWKGEFVTRHAHDVDGDLVGEEFQVQCPECKTQNVVSVPDHIERRRRPPLL